MCGLVAFSGAKPPDKTKLILLGIFNESRGKDSSGICHNNIITKSDTDTKLFRDLVKKVDFDFSKTNSILIHTRKSTTGHGLINSHPFGFRRTRANTVVVNDENKPYKMIGMHNGTIKNWKELITKYDLGSSVDMDSKAICAAIYKTKDLTPLKNYEGSAALIMLDVTKDIMYVYKGCKEDGTEERTLYYVKEEDGIYFSSLIEPLFLISDNTPKSVPGNTVLKVEKGKITSKYNIVREIPNIEPVTYRVNNSKTFSISNNGPKTDEVYLYGLRYFANGIMLNGSNRVSKDGFLGTDYRSGDLLYFFNGFLMKDYTAYHKFNQLVDKEKIDFYEFSKCIDSPANAIFDIDKRLFQHKEESVYYNGKLADGEFIFHPVKDAKEFVEGTELPSLEDYTVFYRNLNNWIEKYYEITSVFSHVAPYLSDIEKEAIDDIELLLNNYKSDEVPKDGLKEVCS